MNLFLRTLSWAVAGAVTTVGMSIAGPVWAAGDLTVVSFGGAYTRSQILAYVQPYEEQTGISITVEDYNGGLEGIRAQVESYNTQWDVVDLELADAIRGCEQGLLEKIDHTLLPPAPDGTPAQEDFISGMLPECAVGEVVFSNVIAYDGEQFKDNPPQTLADFFDLNAFPGKRGLRRSARVNMEWALIADGVALDKVYEVLSTEEGIERALEKLDGIKREIVWWEVGAEPPQLLADGRVAMSSAWNGRVYDAVQKGNDLNILWDAQIWELDLWGIPKRTRKDNLDAVLDFVKFATDTQRLADQAKYIPYGPARKSSMALIPEAMRAQLPTAPENTKNALRANAEWWAQHQAELDRRFQAWLTRKPFFFGGGTRP